MTQRQRKFAGVLLLLASIVVYAWAADAIYQNWLSAAPGLVALVYFALAGIGWFVPAAWIIRWMARPN
jgi:hypothetical protein